MLVNELLDSITSSLRLCHGLVSGWSPCVETHNLAIRLQSRDAGDPVLEVMGIHVFECARKNRVLGLHDGDEVAGRSRGESITAEGLKPAECMLIRKEE